MRANRYYAATLIGEEPMTVLKVFSFSAPSLRNRWVNEWVGTNTPRVSLTSKLARKHPSIEMIMSGYGENHVWLEVV